jgi:hypothetical protein
MLRRRKRMPGPLVAPWERFQAQAERVERARQALLGCLPVGRVDPAPVPVGLDLLHDELRSVRGELASWKVAPVDATWAACRDGIDEALAAIPEARRVTASTTELEELLDAVGECVAPLDAWHDAERSWLRLRVRTSGPAV